MYRDERFIELTEAAANNGGWVTPSLAKQAGIPGSTFYRLARTHRWQRIQPGIFGLPGVSLGWRSHLDAALHHLGRPAAVTGMAALVLHGLEVDRPPEPLQMVVPDHRAGAVLRSPVHLHRSICLTDADITEVDGWPVTRVGWALAHFGMAARPSAVMGVGLAARQAGLVDVDDLDDVLARAGTAPGTAAVRRLRQELAKHQPESALELQVRRLLLDHGLTPEPGPFPFRCRDGVVVHLDIAFPDAWVAVEVDGRAAHGDDAFDTDRTRWGQAQRSGWRIIWATSGRLRRDSVGLVAETREAIAERRRGSAAPATRCRRPGCPACVARTW